MDFATCRSSTIYLWAQVQAQDTAKKLNIQRDNSLASTSLVDFGPICTLYSVMFFRKKRSGYSFTNVKC